MSSTPQPGDVLAGKYQVERVLGVGGMGAVVSAHHIQLDQKVAIKYLLPEALQVTEVVERFAREAKAAAKIRGEHVARVIDVGKFDDGAPYMVMEYLEGRDLAKQLEEYGPLQIRDAVRYILETCEALAEAHAARIVHRDLKPANLFLAKQPDTRSIVKVLDFGISKVDGGTGSAGLTKTQAFMGTAYYMSPEQMMQPKLVDARSDIWALGCILYELLAGVQPFRGETVPEIVAAILANKPQALRSVRADVPAELEAVIARCMSTSQDARPATVGVLAEMLAPFAAPEDRQSVDTIRRVLGTLGPLAEPRGSMPSISNEVPSSAAASGQGGTPAAGLTAQGLATSVTEPPKKRSAAPAIVAAVAIVAGIGVGGVFWSRGRDAQPAPAPGGGIVSAPPTAATSAAAAGIAAPPAETLAPLPAAPPATNEAPPPAQTALANVGGNAKAPSKTPDKAPDKTATAKSKPSASASAAPASAPQPPASAAPAAAPPPAGNTSKNPLQMGIK